MTGSSRLGRSFEIRGSSATDIPCMIGNLLLDSIHATLLFPFFFITNFLSTTILVLIYLGRIILKSRRCQYMCILPTRAAVFVLWSIVESYKSWCLLPGGGGGGGEPLSNSRLLAPQFAQDVHKSVVTLSSFGVLSSPRSGCGCFRLAIEIDQKARTFQFSLNWQWSSKDSSIFYTVYQITTRLGDCRFRSFFAIDGRPCGAGSVCGKVTKGGLEDCRPSYCSSDRSVCWKPPRVHRTPRGGRGNF